MTVATKQLAIGEHSSGGHDLYTVPPDKRTIVKSVVVWNRTGGSLQPNLAIAFGGGSFTELFEEAIPAYGFLVWEHWVVLDAGQVLHLYTPGDIGIVVSGSELEL